MSLESRPSAPPVRSLAHATSGDALLTPRHHGSDSPAAPEAEQDSSTRGLVKDVLQKAHGNPALAANWLSALGGPEDAGYNRLDDLDVAAAEAGAPGTFFCPISFAVMRDPVMLSTGQTFERHSIEQWLARGHNTCPATGQVLEHPVKLTPNLALRHCIEGWAEKNAVWLLGPNGHVKPIPDSERLATLPKAAPQDADLALAIRLQEEELGHRHAQRAATVPMGSHPIYSPRAPRNRGRGRRRARQRTWPLRLVLYAMTTACLALVILSFWRNGWQVENLHDNPLIGAGAGALQQLGSKSTPKILQPHNQWWRFLSSAFLPSGVLTLFAVVESLWTFALHLDPVLWGCSALSIPFIFLTAAIVGGLASANLAPDLDACGASAGVCGLLGVMWVELFMNRRRYRWHVLTTLVLILNTALFIILGFLPLLDNFYHILALGTGALLAPALLRPQVQEGAAQQQGQEQRGRRCRCVLRWMAALAGVAAVLALLAVGVVGLAVGDGGVGESCRWCPDFACIDTRWWDCQPQLAGAHAPSCVYTPSPGNNTASVRCPTGVTREVPIAATAPDTSALMGICSSFCQAPTVGSGAVPSPPPPSTIVIRASG